MALRYRAELDTAQFVSSAQDGTAAMKVFRDGILETGAALKAYDKTGGASSRVSGGAAGKATGSARAPAAAKAPPEDKAQAKAASELAKSREYVYQIRQRQEAAQAKADARAAADVEKLHAKTAREDSARNKLGGREREQTNERNKASWKSYMGANDKVAAQSSSRISGMFKAGGVVAAVAMAAIGPALAAGTWLGKFALGYRGLYQLNALSMRAQWNFRSLFRGVDPSPVVRSWDKITSLVNPRSFIGATLGDILTRGFNGVFRVVEKLQPYISTFATGLVYGFLVAETAILKVEIALAEAGINLDDIVGGAGDMEGAFNAGAIAAGTVVVAAVALGGWLTFCVKSALKLASVVGKIAAPLGFITKGIGIQVDMAKGFATGGVAGARAAAVADEEKMGGGPALSGAALVADRAKADGQASGKAMGAGMVAGMMLTLPDLVAAGKAMSKAADSGVKTGAEIHSPSKLFERRARQMGEGAELGFQGAAPGVQRAAGDAMVPDMPSGGGGPPRGGGDRIVQFIFHGPVSGDKGGIAAAIRAAVDDRIEDVMIALGGVG